MALGGSLPQINLGVQSPTNETSQLLEAEDAGLDDKIKALEGKMLEFLPCPVPLCAHNFKYNKNKKRTAEPIIRPSKLSAKVNENKLDVKDFKIPRKTAKSNTVPKENIKITSTKNKFAALNTANDDVEDVTPAAPKVKPVMMKLFPEYNLILQDIHRTHPTATNTHIGGLLASTDPEDIKKDLIDQGIKIEKVAQLRQFKTKSPLPIFMIEITRDENVDDIFKIRSCLYMQIKFDPFRKNSRPTQCYNCNFFHHASQNCSMKTRCLKCGGGHRTGQCEIKEKIVNPTCINCNAQGHMASSTECLLFPKPRKGVEATLVALTPSDQEPFLVASIYAPPGPNYRNLGADLDGIFNIFKSAFLAGDYNAKHTSWGCNYSDPRGNYLLRYITNNNLDLIAPPTPTRYGTDSASTLDYALIKNLIWPCTADSIPELSSDHNPIDSQVSNLTDEILNAHASASRPFYHTEQPYVQGELKELFKERNKARKTWQHTRHPQHKTELNRLQNAIKRKIYHYRQQAWEDNLSTLNAEDNSLWGIAKAFRKKISPISALNGPTGIALSDTNKTEVIAHSLEKQFHLNDIHNPRKDEIITSVVDAYMDSNINNTDIIPPHSPI
ncbi:PRE_C2HC domain-containing protein [Trichonephila clavipes]|nr:PRE_C2HC domain-containing protein [Trichonephila clavipes]